MFPYLILLVLLDSPKIESRRAYFTQRRDHFNETDHTSFQQRYVIRSYTEAPNASSPLIFLSLDYGGDFPEDENEDVSEDQRSLIHTAPLRRTRRPIIYTLTHRYYSDSNVTSDLSLPNLKWLSSRQALADAANFIRTKNREMGWANPIWIMKGCSYPGNLALWMRQQYPDLVLGAISEGAPVVAKANFIEMDQIVEKYIKKTSGMCFSNVVKAFKLLSKLNPTEIKEHLGLCEELDPTADRDNLILLHNYLQAGFQDCTQYGCPMEILCKIMNDTDTHPVRRLREVMVVYQRNKTKRNACIPAKQLYVDALQSLKSTTLVKKIPIIEKDFKVWLSYGMRLWAYQKCTEFGFFHVGSGIFGNDPDVGFWIKQLCTDTFGISKETVEANIEASNLFYKGRDIKNNITNVFILNGDLDPWHTLGITQNNLKDPNSKVILQKGKHHCGRTNAVNEEEKKMVEKWIREVDGKLIPNQANTTAEEDPGRSIIELRILTKLSNEVIAVQTRRVAVPVKIANGNIRGERLKLDWSPDFFHVFKSIPYAAPPVGSNRFQPPEPIRSWNGIMNATRWPRACSQRVADNSTFGAFNKETTMDEDCLYLNVFAPAQRFNETYAVIVFIHGGGFQVGSSADYSQEAILNNFVSRKIVFVTLNYRLGPLGFLSTGDEVIPGNNGLRDIIMALEWVRKNIGEFGGNPSKVTLMGHGSGGTAASLIGLSNLAQGLVHRLILMSGNALTPGAVRDVVQNATQRLQLHLGCRAYNSTQVLECLKKRSVSEILDGTRPRVFFDSYEEFVPTVDGDFGVVMDDPENLVRYRAQLPTLLGSTKDESGLDLIIFGKRVVDMSSEVNPKEAQFLVRNLTMTYEGFTNHELIRDSAYFEYVNRLMNPTQPKMALRDSIVDMYSSFYYHAPVAQMARLLEQLKVPVFVYSFEHTSKNIYSIESAWKAGAFHGSDLILLFKLMKHSSNLQYLDSGGDRQWQQDRRVVEVQADLLCNFAKHKEPTPQNVARVSYPPWTVFESKQLNYYRITDSPTANKGYHWSSDQFWNFYVRKLDNVDVGNLRYIETLKRELSDYQRNCPITSHERAFGSN